MPICTWQKKSCKTKQVKQLRRKYPHADKCTALTAVHEAFVWAISQTPTASLLTSFMKLCSLFLFSFFVRGQSPSQWLCWCQCCSHSGYRHPVAAVDFLAACPPPLLASSLITLAYWSSQGHGTLELRLGLHQLMTDYSTMDPREQAGGAGTEGAGEQQACSALQ